MASMRALHAFGVGLAALSIGCGSVSALHIAAAAELLSDLLPDIAYAYRGHGSLPLEARSCTSSITFETRNSGPPRDVESTQPREVCRRLCQPELDGIVARNESRQAYRGDAIHCWQAAPQTLNCRYTDWRECDGSRPPGD